MANTAESIESLQDIYNGEPDKLARYWLDAIDLSERQEKDWTDSANRAVDIYSAGRKYRVDFNILHSNVQTEVPALYNSRPDPDVRVRDQRKKPGDDPEAELARKGAQAIEMGIRFQMDEYDFDAVAESAVLDMRTAGRGVARVRWKSYMRTDKETGEQQVAWEEAPCQHVSWRNFRRGPGSVWAEVTWVAYELFLDRDEIRKLMAPPEGSPPEVVEQAKRDADSVPLDVEDAVEGNKTDKEKRELSLIKRARAWEVWDKTTKQIFFVCPGWPKRPLKQLPDPLGLQDFFDCAPPLQAISNPDIMTPVCPYDVYRRQAEEIDDVTKRITALIDCLRYRGIRASEITEFDELDKMRDGQFLPSSGAMALLGGAKGLTDAIWTVPIEIIQQAVRELITCREAIKQTIYEITGLADILRGATDPNETLGAQQIKAQWGSLRINKEQRKVQRWCASLFSIQAEIIANKFADKTIALILGEQPSPELMQVLRSDIRRQYLIDVATDSTIKADLVRNQEQMSNFMVSTGQFIQTFVPLLQSGTLPPAMASAAVTVYAAFARQFKLGKTVEDTLAMLEEGAQQAMAQSQPDPVKQQQEAAMQDRLKQMQVQAAEQTVHKAKGEAQLAFAKADEARMPEMPDQADFGENAFAAQTALTTAQSAAASARAKDHALAIKTKVDAAKGIADIAHKKAQTQKTLAQVDDQQVKTAVTTSVPPPLPIPGNGRAPAP